jgi:hypothetical protein
MVYDVIIDSSTYGNIAKDKANAKLIIEKISRDPNFLVHNFKVIRDELRRAPSILPIYDRIVASTIIDDSNQIKRIAEEYFKEYKKNGGGVGKKKIFNDFKIVACASLKKFDLIVSDDERTMKSSKAISAYKEINFNHSLRTPYFFSYKDLKRKYS